MSQANPLWRAPRIHASYSNWDHGGPLDRSQISATARPAAFPKLAILPGKPCGTDGVHRLFHGAHRHLPSSVCLGGAVAPATPRTAFPGDGTFHARVVHAADAGSVSMGPGAAICATRSRCHLRKRLRRHDPEYGNAGSAYCAAITLAESLCGATSGLHPT